MKRGLAITAVAILAAGCGRGATKSTSAPGFTGDPESKYCRDALDWQLVDLDRSGDQTVYWTQYSAFLNKAMPVAPPPIEAPFARYADYNLKTFIPVLRKYHFDEKEFKKGNPTAAEKKIASGFPPKIEADFELIVRYESQVCGASIPRAADVKFTGNKASVYCKDVREAEAAFEPVRASGFDPLVAKAYWAGPKLRALFARQAKDLPAEIAEDAKVERAFTFDTQIPTIARYGYDLRRIIRDAPVTDRWAMNLAGPEIRDHEARIAAYQQQVCGMEE